MPKRALLTILFVFAVTLLMPALHQGMSTAKESSKSNSQIEQDEFMQQKLKTAHKVIKGLATDDFQLIEEGAREWLAIAETATWKVARDPIYMHYSRNFENASVQLLKAAKAKSVEKATFAYAHITFACTACHQHVRDVKQIASP